MSSKIEGGVRTDLMMIEPDKVLTGQNGRSAPHSEADIKEMADSYEFIVDGKEQGQVTPVVVRRTAWGQAELALGYRRLAGALEYNRRHPDRPMKIACKVQVLNDLEVFVKNVTENKDRKSVTVLDDALNQKYLRETFKWTDAAIAGLYRCEQSYISQLKKLPTLPAEIQKLLHCGKMALGAALAIIDLPAAAQLEGVAAALVDNPDGKVDTAVVVKQARKRKIATGGKQSRTISEIRKWFETLTGPAENADVKELAELMLSFVAGKITDEAMAEKVYGFCGVPLPVKAEPVAAVVASTDTVVEPVAPVAMPEVIAELAA